MQELKELSNFIANFHLDNANDHVLSAAGQCTMDSIGTALGACKNPLFTSIRDSYLSAEIDGGTISLWGSPLHTSLRSAIFLNAMMGHVLELDDVHTKSKTHIGTVVIPAAWGLAEYLHSDGKSFIEAVICGYETMARIGMGFGVSSHRNKGWHVTGTAGTFGSAAACAKLLNFNESQILSALGLAGTQSCSTWAFLSDGATNKILHPARASLSGFDSCLLTLGGMRGSAHILDSSDGGIFPMMSDEFDYSFINRSLGEIYEILNIDKKPYPCCRSTHCAIDAAIKIKEKKHLIFNNIKSIIVKTYSVGYKQCGFAESSLHPKTPTDAKFSIPYTVVCALQKGAVGLDDFLSDSINAPEIQKLLEKVTVLPDDEFTEMYPSHWGCEMIILTNDGCSYSEKVLDASGSISSPLSYQQLLNKIYSCCSSYPAQWLNSTISSITNILSLNTLPSLSAELQL